MIDYQIGICWNLSPEFRTEGNVVFDRIIRTLFSYINSRRLILDWLISYLFHEFHLFYDPVLILWLLFHWSFRSRFVKESTNLRLQWRNPNYWLHRYGTKPAHNCNKWWGEALIFYLQTIPRYLISILNL